MSPSRLLDISDLPFEFCHLVLVRLALGHANARGIAEVGAAQNGPPLRLSVPELLFPIIKVGQLVPGEKARKLSRN